MFEIKTRIISNKNTSSKLSKDENKQKIFCNFN